MAFDPDRDLKGGEARLWQLIEERTRVGADVRAIDQRIWDLFGEEWAVLFTDLSGFSRHSERFGIIHFLQIIHEHKKLLLPIVWAHDGLLIKTEADSLLLLFRRPSAAVACAAAMRTACAEANERRVPEEQILLCVGGGFGRILRIGDADVYGPEVNWASKLGEDIAGAGDVLITPAMRAVAEPPPGCVFEETEAAPVGTCYRVVAG